MPDIEKNPWAGLRAADAERVGARRADESHRLDYFWGVDVSGRYLFFLNLHLPLAGLPQFPKIAEIAISYRDGPSATDSRLVFELSTKEHWEVFFALCRDLMNATSEATDSRVALPTLVRRVLRWQKLLRRSPSAHLSAEEVQGLFAELTFCRDELAPTVGLPSALTGWRGPSGGPQDFCIGERAVEVKCKLGGSRGAISISSAEQLAANVPELYLFVLTASIADVMAPDALSLYDLVSQLKLSAEDVGGETPELLESRLAEAGWLELPEYKQPAFIVIDRAYYIVREGFPRITPSSLPTGVIDVRYGVDLTHCSSFVCGSPWRHDAGGT